MLKMHCSLIYYSLLFRTYKFCTAFLKYKFYTLEINLEPRDHEYGKLRFGSGIIRIVFSKGNQDQSNNLYGGPVVHDKEPQRSRFLINSLSDSSWSDNFHTYVVIWTPGM